jgi:hypothetical protein
VFFPKRYCFRNGTKEEEITVTFGTQRKTKTTTKLQSETPKGRSHM